MTTRTALIVVDVQPTFCEGGELPVDGGNACAERIAAYLTEHADDYTMIATTQDWHIDPGDHFAAAPDYVDSWPPHGLAGTANAELHPAVRAALAQTHVPVLHVRKGRNAAAYSGFEGTDAAGQPLGDALRASGVSAVDVVGIAESHCVDATARDAIGEGFATTVLSDLTVPVTAELGAAARERMRAAGVTLRPSTDGHDR